MKTCREAISLMHEYYDGMIEQADLKELRQHVKQCGDCADRFQQYEQTQAYMRAMPKPQPSVDLANRIMDALPQPKKRVSVLNWIKRHPAITAAAVFVAIMLSSLTAFWDQNTELIVKGTHLDQVVIRDQSVIVPAGAIVQGDLTIENGQLQIEDNARIQGNVVVIDGDVYAASTAEIGGKLTEVNQAIDWLWYKLGETVSSLTP
ncbi:zf-HC2 domain-containing protein [Marinicrinis sediminis]|uniref:Zf-HC2 domain-containing protein n=1 Tax=Marinicrinis sediminis TaxID=1652465 RepID=A0ABW5REM6_9BACL